MLAVLTGTITEWKSKGFSNKKLRLLLQEITTLTQRNVGKLFIVCELDR